MRILAGDATLPPPSADELRVLARVGAAPGTRLACQARPAGYIKVAPLLPPNAEPRQALAQGDYHSGKEQEIAVLFVDLRDFTRFSERQLPYDVVFLLNRYFRAMGEAVEDAGGHVDKFHRRRRDWPSSASKGGRRSPRRRRSMPRGAWRRISPSSTSDSPTS